MTTNLHTEHLNKIATIKPLIESSDADALRALGYGGETASAIFAGPITDADIIEWASNDLKSLETAVANHKG